MTNLGTIQSSLAQLRKTLKVEAILCFGEAFKQKKRTQNLPKTPKKTVTVIKK